MGAVVGVVEGGVLGSEVGIVVGMVVGQLYFTKQAQKGLNPSPRIGAVAPEIPDLYVHTAPGI